VDYQGSLSLTRTDAQRYLDWLNAGKSGKHWEALRERQKTP
jgi:hypothetical protein